MSKRQRYLKARQRHLAENPPDASPYEAWPDWAKQYRDEITEALAANPGVSLAYRADRPSARLTVEELALTLYAVDEVGAKGIGYGQLAFAFRRWDLKPSNAKSARCFKVLLELGIIEQVKGHQAKVHGRCYARPRKTELANLDDLDKWLNRDAPGD